MTSTADLHQSNDTWSIYSRLSGKTRARLRAIWTGMSLNPTTASQLRYELEMLILRLRCALSPSHRAELKGLSGRRELLVHLGCGNALLPEWINVDCYPPPRKPGIEILTIDMRTGLPFADGSVQALFSEHFLEHLPVEIVRQTIVPEMARIIRSGGRLRLGIPNGEYFIEKYIEYRQGGSDPVYEQNRTGKTPMTILNEVMHSHGHHFLYDFETMKEILVRAGFVDVRHAQYGDTSLLQFVGKDRPDEWRQAMTLYIEATKP
jgi:predicted SAM-dependent methyltransferase